MGKLDNLETPKEDFVRIISRVGLGKIDIDLMATKKNRKARRYINKKRNLFRTELKNFNLAFINAPHSIYNKVVPYIINQYTLHPYNLICLIPSNNRRTSYWQKYIEPNNIFWNKNGFAYWYPYDKPIKFLKNGNYILNKNGRPEHAHNGYEVLVLLKKVNIKRFKKRVVGWYS